MKQQTLNKLMDLIKADLPELEKNSIIPTNQGYLAFGKYYINSLKNGEFEVIKHSTNQGNFSSIKLAISWCIADKCNQWKLSEEILELEKLRFRLVDDLFVRSTLVNKFKNIELQSAVDMKIGARKDRIKLIDIRLSKCINLAKYWQIQGFNNETARTRRPASQRTSR